jgi:hypothetical protein
MIMNAKYEAAKLLRDYSPAWANMDLDTIIARYDEALARAGITWEEFGRSMAVYLPEREKERQKRSRKKYGL